MTYSRDGERRRTATFFTHVLFIIIIFILPELVMAIAMPHRRGWTVYPGLYIKNLIYIAAFYINYYIIIDRTLVKGGSRRLFRFLGWNLLIIAVGLLIGQLSTRVWFPAPWRHGPGEFGMHELIKAVPFFVRDGVMMILTIGLAVALRLSIRWKDVEQQRQELVATQRSTELDNLKSQLNPHFLFNTLNTIYALIDINPEEAKSAVHRLSGLLRYMLYENSDSVSLSQETEFIEDYVELMRKRLGKRPVNVMIETGDRDLKVAPLLFVPLIENAFKYGNTGPAGSPITIEIKVHDGVIECTTENSYTPVATENKTASSGIGLANLRRRLTLLYGNTASLRTSVKDNIFKAKLTLPI